MSLYSDFHITVSTTGSDQHTPAIKVSKGVLQGDTLSSLLVNLVFNTMLQNLKVPTLSKCGVLWGNNDMRTAWTQFADDAAIISESQVEAQNRIYFFRHWTSLAHLLIRPDKCPSYGAGKRNG